MQCEVKIDSESILVFPGLHPCVRMQEFGLELVIFMCPKLDTNATQV